MYFKKMNYILATTVLTFTIVGCGNSETADNTYVIEDNEKVAIYIPEKEIEETSTLTQKHMILSSIVLDETMIKTVKEDAEHENIAKWFIYDNSPSGATINNIYDDDKESQVISFIGDTLKNGFKMSLNSDTQNKIIQWSIKYTENYIFYVRLSTEKGYRYLYYTSSDYNYGVSTYDNPHYIHHGLGSTSIDGTWQTVTRDLSVDLNEFESNNTLISVDAFFVRGSGFVDDIILLREDNQIETNTSREEDNQTVPHTQIEEDTQSEESRLLKITEAIDTWLFSKNKKISYGRKTIISDDKRRAVVYAEDTIGEYTNKIYILDISSLDDIQSLSKQNYYYYSLDEVKMKKDDYIVLARNSEFLIYDYNSGEEMSKTSISNFTGVTYLTVTDNYTIFYKHQKNILFKLDFTDRRDPILSELYIPNDEEKISYTLSETEHKVLVNDENGSLVTEVSF